jgi:hypothetical protein
MNTGYQIYNQKDVPFVNHRCNESMRCTIVQSGTLETQRRRLEPTPSRVTSVVA